MRVSCVHPVDADVLRLSSPARRNMGPPWAHGPHAAPSCFASWSIARGSTSYTTKHTTPIVVQLLQARHTSIAPCSAAVRPHPVLHAPALAPQAPAPSAAAAVHWAWKLEQPLGSLWQVLQLWGHVARLGAPAHVCHNKHQILEVFGMFGPGVCAGYEQPFKGPCSYTS